MTWLNVFLIYYFTYQGVNFLRYCYNTYGRQTTGQRRERRMDYEKPKKEDNVKGLFELLSENEQRERAQAETVPLLQGVGEGASEEGFEEIIKTETQKES
eukprot:SAG31_NODE_3595_length_4088_cov_2.210078_4_plen_100_part_00